MLRIRNYAVRNTLFSYLISTSYFSPYIHTSLFFFQNPHCRQYYIQAAHVSSFTPVKAQKESSRSIEPFSDTANRLPPCCLHFDGFRDFLARELSLLFPCRFSLPPSSMSVERVGKLVVRIRVESSRK